MAQYAAVHFPEFLKTVSTYSEGSLAVALEHAFLGFDATLVTEDVKKQLKLLAASGEKTGEAEENDEESTSFNPFGFCRLQTLLATRRGREAYVFAGSGPL